MQLFTYSATIHLLNIRKIIKLKGVPLSQEEKVVLEIEWIEFEVLMIKYSRFVKLQSVNEDK